MGLTQEPPFIGGHASSPPEPIGVVHAQPISPLPPQSVSLGVIKLWPHCLHSTGGGPLAVVLGLAFKDASCMAVGKSSARWMGEGCFGGRHPCMLAFVSGCDKVKDVADHEQVSGLRSMRPGWLGNARALAAVARFEFCTTWRKSLYLGRLKLVTLDPYSAKDGGSIAI